MNLKKKVRKKLIDKDMKLIDLANLLGISLAYLYDILNGSRKATKQRTRIIELLEIN